MEEATENLAPEAAPTLGETLARSREAQGISRNEVAQRLHMSPTQVEALEAGDYARLPKGTFLRGFVRNYAKLVGLDPESVLPLLAENAPSHPAPGIVVPSQNIRFDPLGQRFASPWVRAGATAVVIVALAFAGMYWWLFMRPQLQAQRMAQAESQPAASTAPAPASVPSAPEPSVLPPLTVPAQPEPVTAPSSSVPPPSSNAAPGLSIPSASSVPPASQPSTAPANASPASPAPAKAPAAQPATMPPVTTPVANTAAAPAKGDRRLHFHFKGESWVEVRDASGRVVFRQLNPAGSEANAFGRPPLQVVVGNANAVELERDGRPYEIEPMPDTDVARFKVE
jgi:cytoskeleton protein RodZ